MLDLSRFERSSEPSEPRARWPMFVMIAALALMVAGTLVTIQTRSIWGLYIFAGAAGLYILARLATFGLLTSWTSALGLLLLAVGCSLLSRWRPPSLPGIAGIACLAASAVCIGLFVRARVRAGRAPMARGDSAGPNRPPETHE